MFTKLTGSQLSLSVHTIQGEQKHKQGVTFIHVLHHNSDEKRLKRMKNKFELKLIYKNSNKSVTAATKTQ